MLSCSVLLLHGGWASDTVKVPDPEDGYRNYHMLHALAMSWHVLPGNPCEDFVNVIAGTVGGEKAGMHHSTGISP